MKAKKKTATPKLAPPTIAAVAGIPDDNVIRIKQLIGDTTAVPPIPAIVPVARSTIYQWMAAGSFPRPTFRAGWVMGWRMVDIRAWLNQQQVA